jgi:uncharacterized protein YyaL (SSP411 family)
VIATLALAVMLAGGSADPAPPNRLASSTSRYLQQHARNPVDWYPWSDEAFANAKRDNKPVFLSIGYSSCHWCRVMEEESFSDPEIAKLLNESFVSVKVDRDERPDLDAIFLEATRTLTGEAGWPNNLLLTPDGKPFFAAAYIPKEKFRALIPRMAAIWKEHPSTLIATADMVAKSLLAPEAPRSDVDAAALMRKGYEQLSSRFDTEHGGFLPAPKFPAPHQLMFLLRYWRRSGDAHALEMVERTLTAMRRSPLWDSRGLGFHRYASDAAWQEPHYEKMLCDQAMLALVYLEAHQATGKQIYAATARDIFTYSMRELRRADGAFVASQDADERYYRASDRRVLKPPSRDPRVIVGWNGLMIAALAYGANVLDEPEYARAASRTAAAVANLPRPFLDDHAFLAWGLLNLYEATFDVRHLQRAIAITDEGSRAFGDGSGALYLTGTAVAGTLLRPRVTGDESIPSGNSVEIMNLIRAARITGDSRYADAARSAMDATAPLVELVPSAAAHFLSAIDFDRGPSYEVVLAGKDSPGLRREIFRPFVPNKVVIRHPSRRSPIERIAPFVEFQGPVRGRPAVYVCTDHLCRVPATDVAKVWETSLVSREN